MTLGPIHYHDTESTQTVALGTRYEDAFGRVWKYTENGGTAAAPGKLMVCATQAANHIDLAPSVAAAGVNEITVTLGATAATANDYKDGWAVCQDGTGEGIAYSIEGHPAADASATLAVQLRENLTAAIDATTDFDLIKSRYKDVVISVADQADKPVGIFNVTVTADYYGMIQTWGPASVWQDEANATGVMLTTGSATVGQVEMHDAAGEPFIGSQGPTAGAIADYQLVYLQLDR